MQPANRSEINFQRGAARSLSTRLYRGDVMETADTILAFWFGNNPDDPSTAQTQAQLWWQKDVQVDAQIEFRFGSDVTKAVNRELDDWLATPRGRLALILLTDQFPRNIYRQTPQAFAGDPLARSWCAEGIQTGFDQQLRPIERVFFYLPLEHSESLADQNRSVLLFQSLAASVEPAYRSTFEYFLDFAIRHRDIIARFGRFPHRNSILGRNSSPAEIAFLNEPNSSF
jgi:uncharacterized protein (DUF924 family)